MPKKTRAAASNAAAAEADSGDESDEYAVAPKGGETFGAELELRPDVGGSVVGAPYLSLSLWFVIALVVAVVLGAARSGRLEHRDVAGFVFADEPLSARAWSGRGTCAPPSNIECLTGTKRIEKNEKGQGVGGICLNYLEPQVSHHRLWSQ